MKVYGKEKEYISHCEYCVLAGCTRFFGHRKDQLKHVHMHYATVSNKSLKKLGHRNLIGVCPIDPHKGPHLLKPPVRAAKTPNSPFNGLKTTLKKFYATLCPL